MVQWEKVYKKFRVGNDGKYYFYLACNPQKYRWYHWLRLKIVERLIGPFLLTK